MQHSSVHGSVATHPGDADQADGEDLVTAHLHLVQQAVNKLAPRFPRHVERDELWNAGALGLVEAASRYQPHQGVPFPAFAVIRIRGAILDLTRTSDWASRRTRRAGRTLDRAREVLQQRLSRAPSAEELAAELGVDVAEVDDQRSAADAAEVVRLEEPIGDADSGEARTRAELLQEILQEHLPEESLLQRELVGTLHTAVAHLPKRLRQLVEGYYLRGEYLHDLAEAMGVTEARASQLRTEAVSALRAYFAAHFGDPGIAPDATEPGVRQRDDYVARMATTSWQSRVDAAEIGVGAG